MRAITVIPGQAGSVALTDMPEPPPEDGPVLVQTQAIGICGTDLEIINGDYGWAPPGQDRLGHCGSVHHSAMAPRRCRAVEDKVHGIAAMRSADQVSPKGATG